MSPWGVLVSVLEPGSFQTNIAHQVPDSVTQFWNNLSPKMKEDYEDKHIDGSKSWLLLQAQRLSPDAKDYRYIAGVFPATARPFIG